MKTEQAGLAVKLVILILLIALSLALISVRGKLEEAKELRTNVARQVQAQREINTGLNEDIAASGGSESIYDIAREKLGLVEPGERVFVDANH